MTRTITMRASMLALSAFFGTVTSSVAATTELPDQPTISTLAGSGALGFADGPAATASFVAPVGLRFTADGTLLVADRGAQRIRRVASDGMVTTLAGSGDLVPLGIGVPGGFRNGPATTARFDDPEDVAVLPNGTVLVADMGNACLRSIARGVVATFAGRCGEAGSVDGSPSAARFVRPSSLAVDRNGDVFVADGPNGIRRLRDGRFTTVRCAHCTDATAVTVASVPIDALVIASANLLDVLDIDTGKLIGELQLSTSYISGAARAGMIPAGPATAIAAFAADEFVYTDPFSNLVMLAQLGLKGDRGSYLRVLGAAPSFEAPVESNDLLDGAKGTARFDQPSAVAVAPDGRVAVADLGNRRIRSMSTFNHDSAVTRVDHDAEFPSSPAPNHLRIALVGDSYVWTLQGWDDSIAGQFEHLINSERAPNAAQVDVYPIMRPGATVFQLVALIDGELSEGGFDVIVVEVPDHGHFPDATGRWADLFPLGWPAHAQKILKDAQKTLATSGTTLVGLLMPGADDFEDESTYLHDFKGPPSANPISEPLKDPSLIQNYHDDALAALAGSGVPFVDCWPKLLADHAQATRRSLFMTWDHHYSPHARTVVARVLADYFEQNGSRPVATRP